MENPRGRAKPQMSARLVGRPTKAINRPKGPGRRVAGEVLSGPFCFDPNAGSQRG
jgi:hypothetical protein